MIKYNHIVIALAFLAVFSFSCDKDSKCLKTSGDNTSEIRTISSNFEVVELNDKINLYIKQDSVVSLRVEAGANLLPLITTEVSNNLLKIKSDNRCDFLRSYDKAINVFLSVPNLKKITYNGYGAINTVNTLTFPELVLEANKATGSIKMALITDYLKVLQHTGPADFTFYGSSKKTYLYTIGNGWFHFENFESDEVHVNTSGTGDVIVNAKSNLLVELYAIGNVYYYGNPTLTITNHTGSGEVKKR